LNKLTIVLRNSPEDFLLPYKEWSSGLQMGKTEWYLHVIIKNLYNIKSIDDNKDDED